MQVETTLPSVVFAFVSRFGNSFINSFMPRDDERWMREAIKEARQCSRVDSPSDVPVGAVCVRQGEVISRGHNQRELRHDPTGHAELLALRAASQVVGSWRLSDVTLYVTLEPCPMCAGAAWLSRVQRIVYGASEPKSGACGSLWDIPRDLRLNYQPQVKSGVLAGECAVLLEELCASKRVR